MILVLDSNESRTTGVVINRPLRCGIDSDLAQMILRGQVHCRRLFSTKERGLFCFSYLVSRGLFLSAYKRCLQKVIFPPTRGLFSSYKTSLFLLVSTGFFTPVCFDMYRSLLTITNTSGSYPFPAVARWRRGRGGGGEGGADMAAEFG